MRLLPERGEVAPILFRLGGFAALFVAVLIALLGLAGLPDSLAALGSLQLVAALVASAIVLWMDGKRSLSAIGLPRREAGRGLLGGTLLGIAFVLPALAVAVGLGGLRYGPEGGTAMEYAATGFWTALILLPAAAGEEIAVRGYPLRVLVERWGPWPALALTSVAFSALHGANPSLGWLALVNIVLAGVLLGLVCLKTGDLWWATGVHTGWNLATGFVADLPVSGLELVDAPLVEVSNTGAGLVTGGDFGLEGGLAATVALALAILIVARTRIVPARWLAARGQNPPGIRTAVHPGRTASLGVAPRANSAAIPLSSRLASPAPRRSRCSRGSVHGLLAARGQNPPGIRTAVHPGRTASLGVAPRANSAAIPLSSRLASPAPRRSRCSRGSVHGLLPGPAQPEEETE